MIRRQFLCLVTCLACLFVLGWLKSLRASVDCQTTDFAARQYAAAKVGRAKPPAPKNDFVERHSLLKLNGPTNDSSIESDYPRQPVVEKNNLTSPKSENLVHKNSNPSVLNYSSHPSLANSATRSTMSSLAYVQGGVRKLHVVYLPRDLSRHSASIHGQTSIVTMKHTDTYQILPSRRYNHSFDIHQPFSLPQPVATMTVEELLDTVWMKELKQFLTRVPKSRKPVALVTSDHALRGVLLNWLIAAVAVVRPPVSSILVLSLDKSLYELLNARGIPCIHVASTSFLKPTMKLEKHVPFSQAMIIRLTVMRLLNHWGFNVVNYDTDAVIMRNPYLIYQRHSQADIIGSHGLFPTWIRQSWGLTLCIGVTVVRSSPRTGELAGILYKCPSRQVHCACMVIINTYA